MPNLIKRCDTKSRGGWYLVLLFSLASVACSTKTVSTYIAPPVSEHTLVERQDHISVALYPMLNQIEQNRYFGTNLTAVGILPISVLVENNSPSSSYLLSGAAIRIGSTFHEIEVDEVVSDDAAESVGVVGGLLLSPALMFLGGKMASDATVVKHSVEKSELHRTIVSPGKSKNGFVYARIAPEQKTIAVTVPLRDLEELTEHVFNFSINFIQ